MIERRKATKILVFILTVSILATLILSAPAQAYILRFDIINKIINKGDKVSFISSIQTEAQDRVNITAILLIISGPLDINCKFKPSGEIIEGCYGITIQKISNCSFYGNGGYGYSGYFGYNGYLGYSGYNCDNQELKYNITYNSGAYFAGKYRPTLYVMSGNNNINTKAGDLFSVISNNFEIDPQNYCSIRAKNGNLTIEGSAFNNNNKLNFYIPMKNARKGTGYITGQKGKTTFSYKFSVNDIIEYDSDHIAVAVSGKYIVDLLSKKDQNSVLLLDKKNNKLSVIGRDINIQYMNVNFKQGGC